MFICLAWIEQQLAFELIFDLRNHELPVLLHKVLAYLVGDTYFQI